MSKQPETLMKLADVYADASFDQGLHQREVDPAPEIAREALAAEVRLLHALNGELLEALKRLMNADKDEYLTAIGIRNLAAEVIAKAEAA